MIEQANIVPASKPNAFRFFDQLRNNTDAYTAQRISLAQFSETNKRIWAEAETAGQSNALRDLWRRANPVRQETLFDSQSTLLT